MEMDPGELVREGECIIEGTSDDHPLSQGSPHINDNFRDPQVVPRVGDQYQVKIPSLMTESEHLQFMKNPAETEAMVDQSFVIGLPVPIMWVCKQVENIKHEPMIVESERSKEFNINNEQSDVKVEVLDLAVDNMKGPGVSENGDQSVVMGRRLHLHQHIEPSQDHMYANKGPSPFPGSIGSSWSSIEAESFLLGLYIFGKNLILVKKFVGTKTMGDILLHYYGMFYRSDGYRRWSECRNIRSKKCIHGQRIFTGSRQQELFSRLRSHVSKEGQNTLIEVYKMFGEGKISLEDYVSTLKATVGMNLLIEAIGIGKGNQDLTGIVDPVKSTRPEIPVGLDCNHLSSGDIIKFLTGDFRLSKNRSSDLFWDAVWPRLTDNGWNSEERKDRPGSIVFLTPGVKKYSKRRHVKGKHYFDSVTDVLNRVTSEPGLLVMKSELPTSGINNEENGWDTEPKIDKGGPSDVQRQRYLQPRTRNCGPELVMFTVVDTSLLHGEGACKVRELRTLPADTTFSPPTCISKETDTASSEEPDDESVDMLSDSQGDSNIFRVADDIFERDLCIDSADCLLNYSKQGMSIDNLDCIDSPMDDPKDQYVNMCNDKHPSKTMKRQFNRRVKPCQSNYLTPITKRRRLTASGHAETSHGDNLFSVGSQLKEQDTCCHSDPHGPTENMVLLPQKKISSGSSAKGSSDCSESILSGNGVLTALSHEKVERRPLIDLNLPHGIQDFETGETVTIEVADSQDNAITKQPSVPVETNKLEGSETLESSKEWVNVEQQPGGRRQSTRNRPLTAKALEALACGYLSTKRKPRGEKAMLQENSIPEPPRRGRGRSSVKGKHVNVANKVVDYKANVGVDEDCSSNTNIVGNSRVWSERESSRELPGSASPACYLEFSANKDS